MIDAKVVVGSERNPVTNWKISREIETIKMENGFRNEFAANDHWDINGFQRLIIDLLFRIKVKLIIPRPDLISRGKMWSDNPDHWTSWTLNSWLLPGINFVDLYFPDKQCFFLMKISPILPDFKLYIYIFSFVFEKWIFRTFHVSKPLKFQFFLKIVLRIIMIKIYIYIYNIYVWKYSGINKIICC